MDALEKTIEKMAAELVEELLEATTSNGGEPWFPIVVRSMNRVRGAVECAEIRKRWVESREAK